MKRFIFGFVFLIASIGVFAQKYAYVDTEYILSKIPAYKAAQDKLNEISTEWQKELEQEYKLVEKMRLDYQSEKVLLTSEMIEQREKEIAQKVNEIKSLQNKFFGPKGELFVKRQELIKPIQDEVYEAVEEIAKSGKYAVIFDTASGAAILYTNSKYDKSDEVLEKLGYKN
ncbi:MAG: OmpH family outer membrane protein [Bacteroidales bacterium]|nr:OmpH family outer membrane protein [Bacteroidales bacterium]